MDDLALSDSLLVALTGFVLGVIVTVVIVLNISLHRDERFRESVKTYRERTEHPDERFIREIELIYGIDRLEDE